jgi:hypothetical protein
VSGCNTIYYRVDTNSTSTVSYGDWQVYSSAISFANDGNYALDFNAVDNIGHWDDSNTVYLLVDKTNPSLSITPDANTVTNSTTYNVQFTASDNTSGIKRYFVSHNATNYTPITDSNYLLRGTAPDTNTLYVKAQDNADNNSVVRNISIIFSADTNDSDNDTIPDANDTLDGNFENVITTGFNGDANVIVSGAIGSGSFTGLKTITITDVDTNVVEFDHNFNQSDLNLNRIELIKTDTSLIVKLFGQLQEDKNKTIYVEDNSFVSLCIEDADINSESDISAGCTDANEYNFTSCLGGTYTSNGITCTDLGSLIKIENLRHSGARGTVAAAENTTPPAAGASSVCVSYWSCTPWSICINKVKARICIDTGCGKTTGKPAELMSCDTNEPLDDECRGVNCEDNNSCTDDSCVQGKCINAITSNCGTKNNTQNIEDTNTFTQNEKTADWTGLTLVLTFLFLTGAVILAWKLFLKKKKRGLSLN